MGIIDRARALFVRRPPAELLFSKPVARSLLTETAVGNLTSALFELSDPDEVLRLAGKTRRDLRQLETDDEIATHLETRQSAVLASPWRLDDAESPVGKFCWEQVDAWFEAIARASWAALPYGYSVAEVVWRRDGARLVPERIEEKPFEWFTPTRDALLYHSSGGTGGEPVDTALKFLLSVRNRTYRNPRGEALLSRLFWPWIMRKNGWSFWAKFLERHGSPLLVGHSRSNKEEMAQALAAAVQSAVIAVGEDDKVEAIAPANVGEAFDRFSAAVDRRIVRVILGQTLTSGGEAGGSYALGKVHNEVRKDRRDADLRMVRAALQWFVDALVAVNFPPGTVAPRVSFDTDSELGGDRAERDAKLVQAGVLQLTEQYLLRAYDFEAGDFAVGAPAPAVSPGVKASSMIYMPTDGGAPVPLFAARQGFTPAQQQAEALGDAAIAEAGDPIDPEAIGRAIKAARSPDDLLERLAALVDPAKVRPEFMATVERALFAADVLGYAHATQEAGTEGEAGEDA